MDRVQEVGRVSEMPLINTACIRSWALAAKISFPTAVNCVSKENSSAATEYKGHGRWMTEQRRHYRDSADGGADSLGFDKRAER